MKLICLFLAYVLSSFAYADSDMYFSFKKDGDETRVHLFLYKNKSGVLEMRIESDGLPDFMSGMNPTIGYARDLDDDGKLDTWWMIKKDEAVKRYDLKGERSYGTDALLKILTLHYETPAKMYVTSIFGSILSCLFTSISNSVNAWTEFYQETMDIDEFHLRWMRSQSKVDYVSSPAQESFYREILIKAIDENIRKIEDAHGKDYYKLSGLDIGLWYTGGILFKYLGKAAAWVGKYMNKVSFINSMTTYLKGFAAKQTAAMNARLVVLKNGSKKVAMNGAITSIITSQNVLGFMRAGSQNLLLKSKLLGTFTKTQIPLFIKNFGKAVGLEWKYIALNAGLQIGAEAFANYKDVYDPNPITMAENVMTDPDIQQNVGYMLSETVLMTGISNNIKSPSRKFAVCGFVAMGNSGLTNFVIRNEEDYKRVAMDTGWEAVVGNMQVQFDLKALRYFEELSVKNKNPKLKFLGYVVATINQAAGYYGYSKAATYVEEIEKPVLVPAFAEIN